MLKVVGHIPSRYIVDGLDRIERTLGRGIGVELHISSDILDDVPLYKLWEVCKLVKNSTVTMHAPFFNLGPGAVDGYVLEATRNRFLDLVPLVRMFSPEVVVFHTGFHPQKTKPVYDRWLKNAVKTFGMISSSLGVKIALENVFDQDTKALEDLLSALPRSVGICIDIGHLNLFSKVPFELWVDVFKDRIFEFHFHNNYGVYDDHFSCDDGTFDIDRFIDLISRVVSADYIIVLEAKREDDQVKSLDYIVRRMEKWS